MYACLDVDVVVGGFEKRHFDFVPGVARTSAIGLRLSMSAGDLSAQARVSCDNSSRSCASVISCPSMACSHTSAATSCCTQHERPGRNRTTSRSMKPKPTPTAPSGLTDWWYPRSQHGGLEPMLRSAYARIAPRVSPFATWPMSSLRALARHTILCLPSTTGSDQSRLKTEHSRAQVGIKA
jgi:hypothetical protein